MELANFALGQLPRILFGTGQLAAVPTVLTEFGHRVLLVTGNRSLRDGPYWPQLTHALQLHGLVWQETKIIDEPSPSLIDDTVDQYRTWMPQVVLAIGGGSVLDGAKAIAGLLPHNNSVMDHLEGVGRNIPYKGPALPCVAVPTTAGTGSEATKNAVLSLRGAKGYKKSFRHDLLVPKVAIVDPELLATCPPALMAAQGMDAFTQLLEAYVSTRANPFTDSLAWSGIEAFCEGFWGALQGDAKSRAKLAYAALLSGICLAQTGLGVVHGCAGPLGAFFPIPHGVVCGTLLAEAVAINIVAMQDRTPDNPALTKYARVGAWLSTGTPIIVNTKIALDALVRVLREWITRLKIGRLGDYGMTAADIPRVVAQSSGNSMQTNPVLLTTAELTALLAQRI